MDIASFSTTGHFGGEANIVRVQRAQASTASFVHTVPGQPRRTVKDISRDVLAEHHPGISFEQIIGPSRLTPIVRARWHCWQEAHKERPDMAITTLARIFKRDHTSLLHGLGRLDKRRRKDTE